MQPPTAIITLPNLAKGIIPTAPGQLWVSETTYVALPTRFAVNLDAWSRLIGGYALADQSKHA